MSLLLVGLDHRATPLAERERLAYSEAELLAALPRLRESARLEGCVVLSTCNRTEVYASRSTLASGFDAIEAFLAEDRGADVGRISLHAYQLHDEAAAAHLCRVASGLMSMVLGEGQVLAQVRAALTLARRAGTVDAELDSLVRHAIACGRRARSETRISRSPMSFGQAAVAVARQEGLDLSAAAVVVIGTGTMGAPVAAWFHRAGAAGLTVVSHQMERAQAIAAKHLARAASFDDLTAALADADIVVSASQSEGWCLDESHLRGRIRPLLAIDLGVPRSVAPGVARLPGVRLVDLDQMQEMVMAGRAARAREVTQVESIINEEVSRYATWQRARQVAPTIAELRSRAEDLRRSELARFAGPLQDLSAEQRAAVESVTRSLVNKLLLGPVLRLKEYSQEPHGLAYVDVARSLFGLRSAQAESDVAEDDRAAGGTSQ